MAEPRSKKRKRPDDCTLPPIQTRAEELYKKAWGRKWEREKTTLRRSDLQGGGEPDHIAGDWYNDVGDELEYEVIRGMDRVAKALLAPKALHADIVVLNEYKTLLAALTGTTGSLSKETKSVVVSGQPGIGMTTFLLFLLLHRLENELPTALPLNSRYYFIFDAHGVLTLPINAIDEDDRLDECWALVDSNFEVASPCGVLIDNAKRVIQTTSPKVERWKQWRKQVRAKLYIMDLPNVMEIAAIVKEHKLDPSLTFLYASKWGPCSRAIIDVLECIDAGDDVREIERSLDESANSAAQAICTKPSLFRDFMLGSDDRPSSFNSLGSSLLFIGPLREMTTEESRLVRSESMPVVPTKYLFNILLSA